MGEHEHDERMAEVRERADKALPDEAEAVSAGPEGPSAAPGADAPMGGVTGGDPEAEERERRS